MAADGACLCVVPARGGSRRFPRKNLALLDGRPLIAHTIAAARDAGIFDRIVVSTEDLEIEAAAREAGAEVPFRRAAHLATDTVGTVDVCLDVLDRLGPGVDVFACLLPTTPLRTGADVRGAHARLAGGAGDFVMAVTDYAIPPFWALEERDGYLRPFFGDRWMLKSQELPRVCVDNGAVYVARVEAFRRERTFYGTRLLSYWMPRERSVDVDAPVDLALAEFFLQRGARAAAS